MIMESEKITGEDFKIYLSAILEDVLDGSHSNDSIALLIKDITSLFNEKYGTKINAPRFKEPSKRVKYCLNCQKIFFDISKKNQVKTCHRAFAYDGKGTAMFRNGVRLSHCYQEYSNSKRREETVEYFFDMDAGKSKSVADSNQVYSDFANIDANGEQVKSGKVRTVSIDDVPDHGAYGGLIKLSYDYMRTGIFDEYNNVKDWDKFNTLPEHVKDLYLPKVHIIQLFKYDWHELEDEYQRIYNTESEFNFYKERARQKRGA